MLLIPIITGGIIYMVLIITRRGKGGMLLIPIVTAGIIYMVLIIIKKRRGRDGANTNSYTVTYSWDNIHGAYYYQERRHRDAANTNSYR